MGYLRRMFEGAGERRSRRRISATRGIRACVERGAAAIAPALLALGAATASQRPAALDGAPAVTGEVAARLALEYAEADRFAHEALSTALAARVNEGLAEWASGVPTDAPLAAWFADEVQLVAADRRALFEPSGAKDDGLAAVISEGLGGAATVVPKRVAVGELITWLEGVGGVPPWKLKVLRAERISETQLGLLVRCTPRPNELAEPAAQVPPAEGSGGDTTRAAGHLELQLGFERPTNSDAADPTVWRVSALGLVRQASVRSQRRFHDVTEALLARSPAARDQLRPSIGELRAGFDAALGVGFLGHHGVAIGDADGDGLDDVFLCQPGGLPDQLWLRQSDGTAREVASACGLDLLDATTSALFVDFDNDGDQDLVRTTGDHLIVYRNHDGQFRESFVFAVEGGTGLAAADVDGDRRVDLFLCTYGSPYTGGGLPRPYHDARNGTRNLLLVNRTSEPDTLVFEDLTEVAGMGGPDQRFSFAASFEDFDGDGDQDLYIANDFGRNRLWRNDGTAATPLRFVDVAEELGVEDVAAGMGVSWADFDGDGTPDLYVSNMFSSAGNRIAFDGSFQAEATADELAQYRRHAAGNSLFLGRRRGALDEAPTAGFEHSAAASLGLWAWGGLACELDGDGRPDLYVPNGFVTGTEPDDL